MIKKAVVSILVCLVLAFSATTIVGCSSDYDEPASYTHSENDGHLHSYTHNLRTDEYVCELCGRIYPGDPRDLVAM